MTHPSPRKDNLVGAGSKPARRKSIRLKRYDYSQAGAYFVTISTQDRQCIFGDIVTAPMRAGLEPAPTTARSTATKRRIDRIDPPPARMCLNEAGRIVEYTWNDLPNHNKNIVLDTFAIMPNHIHGIIVIADVPTDMERHGLPEIIRQFKTFSARRINKLWQTPFIRLWQRNYYEHVIRDDDDYRRITEYIINNPMHWGGDKNNPAFARDMIRE